MTFCDGTLHSVKSVVDLNRSMFEIKADELENVQNAIDQDGVIEDAWCELCPEQELERLECVEELKEPAQFLTWRRDNIMSRSDGLALVRCLNFFYQIRLDKINVKNPAPLHVFITGGAGIGKS